MTWQDRLRPELSLTSPDGDAYVAQWRGDPRSLKKKLGVFEFPGLVGAVVQDLQVGAELNNLSFSFDGPDHDIVASKFFKSTKQRGVWTINHPTYGLVVWQMMSVKEENHPVESGNITSFKTEWIEPIGEEPKASTAELDAKVKSQAQEVTEKANEQIDEAAVTDEPGAIARFEASVRSSADAVKAALAPLTAKSAEVNARIESIDRAITESIGTAVFSATALAGQLQTMIGLPSQIAGDLIANLTYYASIIEEAVTISDSERSSITVNQALVREVTAVTALAAAAEVVSLNPPTTREQALSALTAVAALFDTTLAGLDANQTALDDVYVSQAQSFNSTSLMLAQVSQLLLKRSFDLATAKLIQLEVPRTPTAISMEEGVDLDQLIATNSLKADDILLLQPGRTVVVYS